MYNHTKLFLSRQGTAMVMLILWQRERERDSLIKNGSVTFTGFIWLGVVLYILTNKIMARNIFICHIKLIYFVEFKG